MVFVEEPLNKIKQVVVNGEPAIQMYLTLKKATLLDPDDYEKVKHLKWIAAHRGKYYYAIHHYQEYPNKQKRICLNRVRNPRLKFVGFLRVFYDNRNIRRRKDSLQKSTYT